MSHSRVRPARFFRKTRRLAALVGSASLLASPALASLDCEMVVPAMEGEPELVFAVAGLSWAAAAEPSSRDQPITEVSISKRPDKATGSLMRAMQNRTHFTDPIEIRCEEQAEAGDSRATEHFFTVEVAEGRIAKVSMKLAAGDAPTDAKGGNDLAMEELVLEAASIDVR